MGLHRGMEMWIILAHFLTPPILGEIVLQDLHGHFESPGYPRGYPDEVTLSWKIEVQPGYKIKLEFAHIDIEKSPKCDYDNIQVITEEKDYLPVCGSSKERHFPFPLVYRTSNYLTVTFTSDFSNDQRHTGFSAFYTAEDIDECAEGSICSHFCNNYIGGFFCSCRPHYDLLSDGVRCGVNCTRDTFTRFTGQFSSPNYPLAYPENSECRYRIHIPLGFQVLLHFSKIFDVEGDPNTGCVADALQISSGGRDYGPFCGTQPPRIVAALDNTVDVTFTTDGRVERTGWMIMYNSTAKKCSLEVLEHGTHSPRQGEYYFGDSVQVSCVKGYELLDKVHNSYPKSINVHCQRNGTWTSSSVECVPVDCGRPRRLRNGFTNFTSTLFGEQAIYSCNVPFYTLRGSARFECSSDADWVDIDEGSTLIPRCEAVCVQCPQLQSTGRIFGGAQAQDGSFPWQVRIDSGLDKGAGALVGEGWVLTAAHVLRGSKTPAILGGVTDLSDTAGIRAQGQRVFIHPGYRGRGNFDNDLALIKLDKRVQAGPRLAPACLPAEGDGWRPRPDVMGLLAGWGRTEKLGVSHRLLYAAIPLARLDVCRRSDYGQFTRPPVTDNMLCAGGPGVDSCQGDSGGAYVFPRGPGGAGGCVVRGLVSFGPPECGGYGVYTHVGRYVGWLRTVMEENGEWGEEEEEE